jgi:hypothetical protein
MQFNLWDCVLGLCINGHSKESYWTLCFQLLALQVVTTAASSKLYFAADSCHSFDRLVSQFINSVRPDTLGVIL